MVVLWRFAVMIGEIESCGEHRVVRADKWIPVALASHHATTLRIFHAHMLRASRV